MKAFLAVYIHWMQQKHLGSSLNCSSGDWKAAAYIKRRRREKERNKLFCSMEKNQTSKSSPHAAACQEIKNLFLNSKATVQTSGEPPIHKERLSVVRLWVDLC